MAWAGAAVLIPLFWRACRILWRVSLDLLQAWWRGGVWADAIIAAGLVAVVGWLWPSAGIWDLGAGLSARERSAQGFEFEGGGDR